MSKTRRVAAYPLLFIALALGALFLHECGHMVVALWFHARITAFNALGIQWFPALAWRPELGYLGWVSWAGSLKPAQIQIVLLAGSITTLITAMTAAVALNLVRAGKWARLCLMVLSFYWIDVILHLAPVFGVRLPFFTNNPRAQRSVAEAYFAATELGMPSNLYLAAVIAAAAFCFVLWIASWRKPRRDPSRL